MFLQLAGRPTYKAGAAGTVTLPVGAILLQIYARSTAGGTVTIFGGDSIPIIANAAPFRADFEHLNWVCNRTLSTKDIVFTSTDSYFVEYIELPGGGATT